MLYWTWQGFAGHGMGLDCLLWIMGVCFSPPSFSYFGVCNRDAPMIASRNNSKVGTASDCMHGNWVTAALWLTWCTQLVRVIKMPPCQSNREFSKLNFSHTIQPPNLQSRGSALRLIHSSFFHPFFRCFSAHLCKKWTSRIPLHLKLPKGGSETLALLFTNADFRSIISISLWLCMSSTNLLVSQITLVVKNPLSPALACLLLCVMSVAVGRRQFISDRQTKHGGFGGGRDARRGKFIALIMSVDPADLFSAPPLSTSQPPPLSPITSSNTMQIATCDSLKFKESSCKHGYLKAWCVTID